MSNYVRPRVGGATVFFTVALAQRGDDLLVREVARLREAVRVTKIERPFVIDAWVVLPDHLHAVWTLPEGDSDYSTRWGAIKSRFTRSLRRVGFDPTDPEADNVVEPNGSRPAMLSSGNRAVGWNPTLRSASKVAKGDAGLWQRRFWERHIRDARDFDAHVRYCWTSPVKHGLVERAEDWALSSVHRGVG